MANLSNINNKFLVTTGGAVGVGVTSPGSKLSIGGTTGSYDSGIGFQPTGTGARIYRTFIATDGSFRFDDVTAGYLTRLTIQAGGNVGIGTDSPGYKLSVANASTRIISATYIDGANGIMSHAGAPNYGLESFQVRGDFISFWTDYDASHYQGTEKMRIDQSGNVGIGYDSPSSFNQRVNAPHLVVGSGSNSAGLTIYSGTVSQGSINFADGLTTTDQYTGGIIYVHGSDNYMSFHTNGGTERMRITSGGDIQVQGGDIFLNSGTNYNDKGVVYLSNERTAIISDIVNATANGDTSLDFQTRKGGTRASAMFIDEFRRVGIGTTSPLSPLTVHGQQRWYTTNNDGNELRGFFNPGGSGDPAELSLYQANGTSVGVELRATGNSYFNGGNVGIGETSPNAKLDVNGALKAQRFFSRNGSFSSTAGNWHNVVDLQQSEYENRTLICSVYTNGTHSYSSATVNVAYNGGSFVLTLGNKISSGSTDIRVSGGYLQYYTPWTSTTNFWRITIN